MLDVAASEHAPSRLAIVVGLVLSGVLALAPLARSPAPVTQPCPMMSAGDRTHATIRTRTLALNPRYFSRSRFAEPMLAR